MMKNTLYTYITDPIKVKLLNQLALTEKPTLRIAYESKVVQETSELERWQRRLRLKVQYRLIAGYWLSDEQITDWAEFVRGSRPKRLGRPYGS